MSKIKEFIESKLSDEGMDSVDYRAYAKDIQSVDSLSESLRESIASVLEKIATDEESHYKLLEVINDVLEKEGIDK